MSQPHSNANASAMYPPEPKGLGCQVARYQVRYQLSSFSQHGLCPFLPELRQDASLYGMGFRPSIRVSLCTRVCVSKKITAHDSILAAQVKQTRDANRQRLQVPFKEDNLVYLSSKNISFPKGLARKLLPKFIGPYKILRDFGNSSFQLELPPHLKRRGVHDIFHSSLQKIHVPNDDWLFPG